MSKLPKGFSFQINGGTQSGDFYIRLTRYSWRICLWFVAITLFFFDVEPSISAIAKDYKKAKEK